MTESPREVTGDGDVVASTFGDKNLTQTERITFSLYIFAVVVLPTGDVKGVNVKLLLSLVLLCFVLRMVYRAGLGALELVLILAIPLIVALEILTGFAYGYYDLTLSFGHGMYVISTVAGCWLITKFVPEQQSACLHFVKLVISALVLVAVLKALIIAYSFRHALPVSEVMQRVSDFFGLQLMSGDVASIGGRIQFVSDTLIPVAVFALLFHRKYLDVGVPLATISLLLLVLSALVSYSRFFWLHSAVALLFGLTSVRRDKLNILYLVILSAAGLYFFDWFALLMSDRFSAAVAGVSDTERTSQIKALIAFFWEAPVFGHGLGTYTTRSIRNSVTPYGYEVQLLALCGQLGLAGVIFLLGLLLYYCRSIFRLGAEDGWYRICLFGMLLMTLIGGMTNPYLLNSTASVNYGMLMVLARLRGARNISHRETRPSRG